MAALDGQFFQGRILHVMAAKPLPEKEGTAQGGGGGATGFKAKKAEQLKQQAESSHNWNALFMRSDAVGDALASRYGVEKRELLDTEAEGVSLAVRLAQGQTHIVQQTKQWLASHGVSLSALEQAASASASASASSGAAASAPPLRRSSTLILVKNIAAKVTQEELRALFSRHGQVTQVLLPPANTLALVEFLEVGEAKKAFRQLAYSKLHGSPLFLEWAPVGTVSQQEEAPAAAAAAAGGGGGGEAEEEAAETEGCTLFVKNLSFSTGEAALRQLFEKHWRLRAASVVTKRDPKEPSRRLSMGYGFVEFASPEDAQQALRKMHGARLDEHVLQLKLSSRASTAAAPTAAAAGGAKRAREGKSDGQAAGGGGTASAKLAVRNVPFEASKKELRELFAAFGQLKTVRLPKKFDGSHRGFAFVEFVSKQEAAKALAALQSTHLYGRHIVVSYAEQERSVEEMRKKMRKELSDATTSLGRRSLGDEGGAGAQEGEDADLGFDI